MQGLIDTSLSVVTQSLLLSSCSQIVPLYEKTVYDGLCGFSISALNYMFLSSLFMAVLGLAMVTLRAFLVPS